MNTESRYLTHRFIPGICATGVLLAEDVAAVIEGFNRVNIVKAVLLDISVLTLVVRQGLSQLWWKILKQKFHTIDFSFNQN